MLGNYLELFKLDNQIQIYRTNIKQTQLILEQMEAKHEQGVVLLNDITRYELLLQSLQLALLQAKNTRDIINNQMVTILGLENNYVINVDRSIINKHINYQDSQYWLERVNDNSYSLKILEKGINLSEQYKKITVAERIPTIGLFVGDRLDGPILIEVPTINKNFNYWYAGIQLKFNIGAAYKGVSKTKAANIAVSKAKQDYEVVKEHIQIEAESAFIRLKEAYEILSTQTKGLELASQNYEIVNNRFLNDLALLTDMLDASNSKLIAELNVSNAQINIIFNYYKLRRVSGNL